MNWLAHPPVEGLPVLVKLRSAMAPIPAFIRATPAGAVVSFDDPQYGVSPGQACVFYDRDSGERVLGGGWILREEQALAA